ncbi:orf1 protein (mitochondrion) [Parastagonospora nodorum SN15]|uniref:Orf1 protein n=1 Tax=Phaeosphaeria nodorum (strain SN15 / ATCC MYA-4574 / FGSC 10173) TaxID=321614 RepID=A7UG04_PHANO|nr:orf1 protein [Parastagonospora nodorum SN15]ABU49438.1 orf1 protein [Parastagonospora nodorum SN15]
MNSSIVDKLHIKQSSFLFNFVQIRKYSTSSEDNVKSELCFSNADTHKLEILKAGKDKSGVYMWTNNLNGQRYVGSSIHLRRRFLEYFNTNTLLRDSSMVICAALLKHGYSQFSLEIIEFCKKEDTISRENYYLNLLNPEYNIVQIAGLPPKVEHTPEIRDKISKSLKEYYKDPKALINHSLKQEGHKRIVTDLTLNIKTSYHAIHSAARALNVDKRHISRAILLKSDKPILARFIVEAAEDLKDLKNYTQKSFKPLSLTEISNGVITTHPNIASTAKALGVFPQSIVTYIRRNTGKPYKGKYWIKFL